MAESDDKGVEIQHGEDDDKGPHGDKEIRRQRNDKQAGKEEWISYEHTVPHSLGVRVTKRRLCDRSIDSTFAD